MSLDLKEIQELIKFVSKSGASEVNIEIGDLKLSIKTPPKKNKNLTEPIIQQIPIANQVIPNSSIETHKIVQTQTESVNDSKISKENVNKSISEDENLITIKSPMIGTFYRKPSPDKEPFVVLGDEIAEGQVICVIEAMKLFNEIESEISGKIVKILIDDMSPVEYDQPLFLIDPK